MSDLSALNFKNEALSDFSIPAHRLAMESAAKSKRALKLGITIFPCDREAKNVKARQTFKSINPSRAARDRGGGSKCRSEAGGSRARDSFQDFSILDQNAHLDACANPSSNGHGTARP